MSRDLDTSWQGKPVDAFSRGAIYWLTMRGKNQCLSLLLLVMLAAAGCRMEPRRAIIRPSPVPEPSPASALVPRPAPVVPPPVVPLPAVTLAPIFSHGMVLQQGTNIPVWGRAPGDEIITVRIGNQMATTRAVGGAWVAHLPRLVPGEPRTLSVEARHRELLLTNVMVGEVWLCAGDAPMAFAACKVAGWEGAVDDAAGLPLRFFRGSALGWETVSRPAISNFSALGFYFGRELARDRSGPVGIVQVTGAGLETAAWIPGGGERGEKARRGTAFSRWIEPVKPVGMRGVAWWGNEGESPQRVETDLAGLVRGWRREWWRGDGLFLSIQPPPLGEPEVLPGESGRAALREAQARALRAVSGAEPIVTIDLDLRAGRNAEWEALGRRLATVSREMARGDAAGASGPRYREMTVEEGRAIISFAPGAGLEAGGGGALKGFSICGADRHFVWAPAEIVGGRVVVRSPNVPRPVAVRYAWADSPVANLVGKNGLPAAPFRTDDFPLGETGK